MVEPNFGQEQFVAIALRRKAIKRVCVGVVVSLAALGMTVTSYSSASPHGGEYTIYWGLMLFGVVTIVRGGNALVQTNRLSYSKPATPPSITPTPHTDTQSLCTPLEPRDEMPEWPDFSVAHKAHLDAREDDLPTDANSSIV